MPVGWTREEAVAAAKTSAEVRRRRSTMTPRERALEVIRRTPEIRRLAAELLEAAHGEGDFVGLEPKLRLQAILRSLEYGIGKPVTEKPPAVGQQVPETPTADDLFGPDGG